jgi:hypothetical protein
VEEEAGRVHFAVLHMYYQCLWHAVEGYLLRDPNPYPAEVGALHGRLLRVGYSVFHHRMSLLAIEESNVCRWWLIYLIMDDNYFLAQELQSSFYDDADESSDVEGSLGDVDISDE